jgi:hypothetical protein
MSHLKNQNGLIPFKCQNPDCKNPTVHISEEIYNQRYKNQELCLCCRDNATRKVRSEAAWAAARNGNVIGNGEKMNGGKKAG